MRGKALGDTIGGALFTLLALFLFWASTRVATGFDWYRYNNVLFPRIVLMVMLSFSLILVARGIWNWKHVPHEHSQGSDGRATEDLSQVWIKLLTAGLLYTVYVIAAPWLGFVLSTILVIVVNMVLLGERKWLRIVSVAFIATIGFVLLFARLSGVDFPRGVSFLKQFSLLLY
jgi:putative tricarboxylic transport membrane protein